MHLKNLHFKMTPNSNSSPHFKPTQAVTTVKTAWADIWANFFCLGLLLVAKYSYSRQFFVIFCGRFPALNLRVVS